LWISQIRNLKLKSLTVDVGFMTLAKLLLTSALFGFSLSFSLADRGSVIFLHVDGAGVANWQALRFITAGPDGETEWDRLPHIAVYRGHMADNLTATSNGGAVAHAYGVRPHEKSFGFEKDNSAQLINAVGRRESLMQEAIRRGLRVGVINSGSIIEPGTAVFLTAAQKRDDYEAIAAGVLGSGADIILSGGEQWMLPEGMKGRHGMGKRKDGRNLISEAQGRGYHIVYDRSELLAVDSTTKKLLGVFAAEHTFNDVPQDVLNALRKGHYLESAPTLAEMTQKALEILKGTEFFLVVEEEGSDNFANNNNAPGVLESLRRADEAIGIARMYIEKNPDTLLLTVADSEAGGWDVIGLNPESNDHRKYVMMGRDKNAAPYGLNANGEPFVSAPDSSGNKLEFVLCWASMPDTSGGILVRAQGRGAEMIKGNVSNVDLFKIMRHALFDDDVSKVGEN
jgi:alkaline phosphatase